MDKTYANVHDSEILSYLVDIQNKNLQLFTERGDKEAATITFNGCIGHRFENVTYCNIINTITARQIDEFVAANTSLLKDGLRYAFPAALRSCEALGIYLKEKSLCVFEIDSVLGLSGFVFAEDIVIEVGRLT